MMKEEIEMTKEDKAPIHSAIATFLSFNIIGVIPILSYIFMLYLDIGGNLFLISYIATGRAMVLVGYLKSMVTKTSHVKGMVETVLLGGLAAFLAYLAGDVLARYLP